MRVIVALVLALQVSAQPNAEENQHGPWKRHVMTPKDRWFDTPTPHPLAYFTQYPALLDMSGDFCYLCTPEKRLAAAKAAKEPKAEVHLVGVIRGFTIYDLFYRFQSDGAVDWKSILVKIGADSYREIYHCEPTQVDASALPSVIIRVGTEPLLKSQYFVGGNRGDFEDDYFWFGKNGPTLVDLRQFSGATSGKRPMRGK